MFKVGDRVRCIREYDDKIECVGELGVVIGVMPESKSFTVEFDKNISGHDGSYGRGKAGHCWDFEGVSFVELVKSKQQSNIRKQAEAIADLIEKKDADYDSAFSKSYKEFGMTSVAIRLNDKVERFKNLVKGEEPNFESIDDTLIDIAGYAILALAERKED